MGLRSAGLALLALRRFGGTRSSRVKAIPPDKFVALGLYIRGGTSRIVTDQPGERFHGSDHLPLGAEQPPSSGGALKAISQDHYLLVGHAADSGWNRAGKWKVCHFW